MRVAPMQGSIIGLAVAVLAAASANAVPPPVPLAETLVVLPPDQCAIGLQGVVRAYAAPVFAFDVAAPTVLRIVSTASDTALLVDIEADRGDAAPWPVVTGAGLAGGDIRIGIAAAGRYRLRVLMTGDAARTGRAFDFRIALSRALESDAAECDRRGGN